MTLRDDGISRSGKSGSFSLLWQAGTQALWLLHAGLSSCGVCCSVACGILVPRPGIKPTSPALQGGFLSTRPPEKS